VKAGHRFTRTVRMLTAEIRLLLKGHPGATQRDLSVALDVSQRTVNSRLQLMKRTGEVESISSGYGSAQYKLVGK
jgi:Mn-dependent DtxR family transcriptional regulator